MQYQRMYLDESEWEEITREQFIRALSGSYRNVETELLPGMEQSGMPLRTSEARYRAVLDE